MIPWTGPQGQDWNSFGRGHPDDRYNKRIMRKPTQCIER